MRITRTIVSAAAAVLVSCALAWAANITFLTQIGEMDLPIQPPNQANGTPGFIDNMNIGSIQAAPGKFTSLNFTGQMTSSSGATTIGSGNCGAAANGTVTGNNTSGQIAIGAAATATCQVNFSATLAVAPNACVIFPQNAAAAAQGTTVARVGTPTTSSFTITGTALATANYAYICI